MTPPTHNQIWNPGHFATPQQATATLNRILDAQDGRFYHPLPTIIDQAAVNKEKRTVDGVASVEEISRTYYKIHIDGIDLKQYKKNPVVLACHSQYAWDLMPGAIGTIRSVTKADGQLVFKGMQFDDDPLADAWFQKIVKQIVRMVSIGFCNASYTLIEERDKKKDETYYYWDITSCELMEISVCPIGANRGAFIGSESAAIAQAAAEVAAKNEEHAQQIAAMQSRIEAAETRLSELLNRLDSDRAVQTKGLGVRLDKATDRLAVLAGAS